MSGAADRDQPCELAVIDGWRLEVLSHFGFLGQEPMNRRRGRGVSGVFLCLGGRSIDFFGDRTQMSASGLRV